MQRIDASYLYQLGSSLRELKEIRTYFFGEDETATEKRVAMGVMQRVATALQQFLFSSVFDIKIAVNPGRKLLTEIEKVITLCKDRKTEDEKLSFFEFSDLNTAFSEFEAVLKAELGGASIYLVSSKNAMDTTALIEAGYLAFPNNLGELVPEALNDAMHAMSCIAFELPTAAAFHLHRVNEAVLKKYWSQLSKEPVPKNMGAILAAMDKNGMGREEIRSALRDIVKLHRNPTIHPEQSLEDVEDAINLYGAIRSVVGFILKDIVMQQSKSVAT